MNRGDQVVEALRLILEPADDIRWVRETLGNPYAPGCMVEQWMLAAIERGRRTATPSQETDNGNAS